MALKLPAATADFLERHHVMTLATQGSEGPWAAALFYASDGDDLIFLSSPSSRHCRNLALQPRCAATIQSDADDWRVIQGIQIEGEVSELPAEELALGQQRYAERFPFVRPGVAPAAIVTALARVHWYRLRIARLYFIDNERGFGQRQQFDA
jgi:uncharacterized protein YhbP (UPF0306 family)